MSEEIAIAWISLTVSVKSVFANNSKIILNNIFGKCSYNCLNGLMGSSGSGKTTLLKCLNGSNKYCISDESKIMVSNNKSIKKCFIYKFVIYWIQLKSLILISEVKVKKMNRWILYLFMTSAQISDQNYV